MTMQKNISIPIDLNAQTNKIEICITLDFKNLQTLKPEISAALPVDEPQFLTVKQFCEKYKYPTGALRAIRFSSQDPYCNNNPMTKFRFCFKNMGRKLLIDHKEFWRIFKESN